MRHAFDAALEDVERSASESDPAPGAFGVAPPLFVAEPPAGLGDHSLWELAAEWAPEADPPLEPPRQPPPSAKLEDIAAELGLDALRTADDLARARRRFMWDNHPDRRADLDRDLANRRVAIANMLLDRALRGLRPRRAR